MLVGIIGNPRTGKTLLATIIIIKLIIKAQKQMHQMYYYSNWHFKDIYSNIVTHITPEYLLELRLDNLSSGIVGIDELWAWLMSRGSGSSFTNKVLGTVAFTSGKSGFDVIWTAQLASAVDKWFRNLTDYWFVALNPTETRFRYIYVSGTRVIKFQIPKIKAMEYYKYYDTQERIQPLDPKRFQKNKAKENIDIILSPEETDLIDQLKQKIKQEVVDELRKELGIPTSQEVNDIPELANKTITPIDINTLIPPQEIIQV